MHSTVLAQPNFSKSPLTFKKQAIKILDEKIIEVDVLFEKVKRLLKNPKKLSNTLQPLDRQRLMFVLFPEGITVRDDAYRTPLTSYILRHLREISSKNGQMVAPRGIEPLLPE